MTFATSDLSTEPIDISTDPGLEKIFPRPTGSETTEMQSGKLRGSFRAKAADFYKASNTDYARQMPEPQVQCAAPAHGQRLPAIFVASRSVDAFVADDELRA